LESDISDKAAIVYILTEGADADNMIGRGDKAAGTVTHTDVATSSSRGEGRNTDGCVIGTVNVVEERMST